MLALPIDEYVHITYRNYPMAIRTQLKLLERMVKNTKRIPHHKPSE